MKIKMLIDVNLKFTEKGIGLITSVLELLIATITLYCMFLNRTI